MLPARHDDDDDDDDVDYQLFLLYSHVSVIKHSFMSAYKTYCSLSFKQFYTIGVYIHELDLHVIVVEGSFFNSYYTEGGRYSFP